MPVRRSDDEPLQQLAVELRSELDTKVRFTNLAERDSSLRNQEPKFLKLLPAIKKTRILLAAQMLREIAIPDAIVPDFLNIMTQAPTLLEELLKIALRPRPPIGELSCNTPTRT